MSYYLDLVTKIKEEVNKNNYPPVYEKKFFDFSVRNCYAYALDLKVHDPEKRILFPGCISSEEEERNIYSEARLMVRLKRDLDFLGFNYRSNDKSLDDNEYRIAIYAFPSFHDIPIGFHVARQDKNGYWSEKPNWSSKPQRLDYCGIEAPKLIDVEPFMKNVLIIKKI